MTGDFARAREAFGDSVIGRILASLQRTVSGAWRTSATGRTVRSMVSRFDVVPRAVVITHVGVTIAIAAILQPFLISVMPATVAPAIPWQAYGIVALFAAAAAWQAEAIAAAWRGSRLASWIRDD